MHIPAAGDLNSGEKLPLSYPQRSRITTRYASSSMPLYFGSFLSQRLPLYQFSIAYIVMFGATMPCLEKEVGLIKLTEEKAKEVRQATQRIGTMQ